MRDPELVVGDDAMGLWKALGEVFPAARHQRCWVHKTRNVTNCLPKSAQPGATKALQEIYNAEDRIHAEQAIKAFAKTYGTKWPKAFAKITDDPEELLAFYDFPAEHWIHLRTTNPIESCDSCGDSGSHRRRGCPAQAACQRSTPYRPHCVGRGAAHSRGRRHRTKDRVIVKSCGSDESGAARLDNW
jgi:putative transposase